MSDRDEIDIGALRLPWRAVTEYGDWRVVDCDGKPVAIASAVYREDADGLDEQHAKAIVIAVNGLGAG